MLGFGQVILWAEMGGKEAFYQQHKFKGGLLNTFCISCFLLSVFHHEGCNSPPSIAHGHHRQKRFTLNVEVEYECEEGYTLVGAKKLSCKNEHWSPEAPQCKGTSSLPSAYDWVGGTVM